MIRIYEINGTTGLKKSIPSSPIQISKDTVWIDLQEPTPDEEKAVENFLQIDIPTMEEMQEIEFSSRFYEENNAIFMTATVIAAEDSDDPKATVVTFILVEDRLVTLRYIDLQAFTGFSNRSERLQGDLRKGDSILIGLLEAIVDRVADVLEKIMRNVDLLSRTVFRSSDLEKLEIHRTDYRKILKHLGKNGDLVSKMRESLVSINRLTSFFSQTPSFDPGKGIHKHLSTLGKDIGSLSDHATFLSNKVNFLLDASLGMVNIEQNTIIKIFSIAAVVLLPPTLVASIYGMNFDVMPELKWQFGYPYALVLMVLSAVLPFLYFKKKRWL